MWLEILVANLATNFQDLVAKVKNLVALAPVLGAILRPAGCRNVSHYQQSFSGLLSPRQSNSMETHFIVTWLTFTPTTITKSILEDPTLAKSDLTIAINILFKLYPYFTVIVIVDKTQNYKKCSSRMFHKFYLTASSFILVLIPIFDIKIVLSCTKTVHLMAIYTYSVLTDITCNCLSTNIVKRCCL